jgi:hypothetical protein
MFVKLGKILLPLIPIMFGIALKMALVDKVPDDKLQDFIINTYARPIWLELIVIAFLIPLSKIIDGSLVGIKLKITYISPIVVFVINLFLVLAMPKFGIENNFINIYIPGILSLTNLSINQYMIL